MIFSGSGNLPSLCSLNAAVPIGKNAHTTTPNLKDSLS
jgi:hypothetical protein